MQASSLVLTSLVVSIPASPTFLQTDTTVTLTLGVGSSGTKVNPTPYTPHSTPCTPYTLHPAPYTLHSTPYTLLAPSPPHPNPQPCTLNPNPPPQVAQFTFKYLKAGAARVDDFTPAVSYTLNPQPSTLNPKPQTLHPQP